MAKGRCVVGWFPYKGGPDLAPLTCETVMARLSIIVAKQARGESLKKKERQIVKHLVKNYKAGVR